MITSIDTTKTHRHRTWNPEFLLSGWPDSLFRFRSARRRISGVPVYVAFSTLPRYSHLQILLWCSLQIAMVEDVGTTSRMVQRPPVPNQLERAIKSVLLVWITGRAVHVSQAFLMTEYEPISSATFATVDLKLWLVGTLHATLAYGIVFTLAFAYLHHFLQIRSQQRTSTVEESSRRRRLFLLLYIMTMFSISTLTFVAGTLDTMNILFPSSGGVHRAQNVFCRFSEAIAMVLASWGNDVLMVSCEWPQLI